MVRVARVPKLSKAEQARRDAAGQYENFNEDQIKEEVARLSKLNFSLTEDKKAAARASNELIKDNEIKIETLVERLDFIRHEAAVANQLERQ